MTTMFEYFKQIGGALGDKIKPVGGKNQSGNAVPLLFDLDEKLITVSESGSSSPTVDSLGRDKVSRLETLFESHFRYGIDEVLWSNITSGTFSNSHLENESSIELQIGTDSGDKNYWQTNRYFYMALGRSSAVSFSFVIGGNKTNVIKQVGIFDDDNGVFLQQNGTTELICLRSKTSGSVVTDEITRNNWNLDIFDGNGASGINLDFTKIQELLIDFAWPTGKVRVGFFVNGKIYYAHEFLLHSNNLTTPFMSGTLLPLRIGLYNDGEAASASIMKQISSYIGTEEGESPYNVAGKLFSVNTGQSAINVKAKRPILSIRAKLTYNSIINRGLIFPIMANIMSITRDGLAEIIIDGTLTNESFASVNSNSIVEYDISATEISGGDVLFSQYFPDDKAIVLENFTSKIPLTTNYNGTTSNILTIVCGNVATTSNTPVVAALNWKEVY